MSKIKSRLLQLIEYKGISKREFCRRIEVSHTFLNGDSEIGSDKVENIASTYPDLSLQWLITGTGEMLVTEKPGIGDEFAGMGHMMPELFSVLRDNCRILEHQVEVHRNEVDRLLKIIEAMEKNHADALIIIQKRA